MPDPIEAIHSTLMDMGAYDESDDAATRIGKTKALLSQSGMSPAKQNWILNGVASASRRSSSDLTGTAADAAQEDIASQERKARLESGHAAAGPILSLPNEAAGAAVAGVEHGIGGLANIVSPDNRLSKFLRKDLAESEGIASPINPTVRHAADVAGGLVPMLANPWAAGIVGGGQSADTAREAGGGRTAQTAAGIIGGLASAFAPGYAGRVAQKIIVPTAIKALTPGIVKTGIQDIVQGVGAGTGLAASNVLAQAGTALDTGTIDPIVEQLKAAPETIALGGLLHPIIATKTRLADRGRLEAQTAAANAEQLKTQNAQDQNALLKQGAADQTIDKNAGPRTPDMEPQLQQTPAETMTQRADEASTGMTNRRIQDQLVSLAERTGFDPEAVIGEHEALTQKLVEQGVPENAARIAAAQKMAGRLSELEQTGVTARADEAAPRVPVEERAPAPNEMAEAEEVGGASTRPVADILREQELTRQATEQPTAHEEPVREPTAGDAEETRLAQLKYAAERALHNYRRNKATEASRAQESQVARPVADTGPAPEVAGEVAPEARVVEAAKPAEPTAPTREVVNAEAVRGNQGQPAPEGLQRAGSENVRSENLQQPPQAGSEAGNTQEPLTPADKIRAAIEARAQRKAEAARTPVPAEGVPSEAAGRKVIGTSKKGELSTDGRTLFINGRDTGIRNTPAARDGISKTLGIGLEPPKAVPEPTEAPDSESLAPSPAPEKTPERLEWERAKAEAGGAPIPIPEDKGATGGVREGRQLTREAYRRSMGTRGQFDPVGMLADALDTGATKLGDVLKSVKDTLNNLPTEESNQILRDNLAEIQQRYKNMVDTTNQAQKMGFWDKARGILSMESLAANNPVLRRVVKYTQMAKDNENMAVAENMRDAKMFIDAPASERNALAKAAFYYIHDAPGAKLSDPMPDGTRLSPENQQRLQAAFDASRKATQALVTDLDNLGRAIPEELAKFRDVMKDILADPNGRYIPMRRYGDKVLYGTANTDEVMARLTRKGNTLTPEEATVLRLARQAKVKGKDDFTYYYGAAEGEGARNKLYTNEAQAYEKAAGSPMRKAEYNADLDRGAPTGIKADALVKLAKDAGIEPEPLMQLLSAIPMRGQTRSSLLSRGIPGATRDSVRAMGEWFTNLASIRAKAGQAENLARAMERIEDPAMRKVAQKYLDVQKQPVSKGATTGKAFLNLYSMGLRPASAAAEAIGGIVMAPYKLGAIGLPKQAASSISEMMLSNAGNLWRLAHLGKESMVEYTKRGLDTKIDPKTGTSEALDFQRAADTGRFGNQAFRDEMAAQSKSITQNLTEKAMILHRNFREANAIGVWKAAYKAAKADIIPEHAAKALEMQGIDCGTRTPREMADAITDFTMNRVDKTTMPLWQSGSATGQVLGTLTSYQTRSLAQMVDIAKVWKNIPSTRAYGIGFTTALVAAFGAGAIPFGNWLMEADHQLSDDPRSIETRALSDDSIRAATYGVTGIAAEGIANALGADKQTAAGIGQRFDAFSRRTAWGNFLHENSLSIADQIPAVSMLGSIGRSMQQGYEGWERNDPLTMMEGIAGSLSMGARDLVKGGRAALSGKVVNTRGETVTTGASPMEGIGQATGFGMSTTQQAGADAATNHDVMNAKRTQLKRFAYRIANEIKDGGDISDVLDDIRAYNAKYLSREDPVGWAMVLDGPTLDNAVKQAYTREVLGMHEANVAAAQGPKQMLLMENAQ